MNSWVVDQALDLEKSYPGEKKKKAEFYDYH